MNPWFRPYSCWNQRCLLLQVLQRLTVYPSIIKTDVKPWAMILIKKCLNYYLRNKKIRWRWAGQTDVVHLKTIRAPPDTRLKADELTDSSTCKTNYHKCSRHLISSLHMNLQMLPNYTAGWGDSATAWERLMSNHSMILWFPTGTGNYDHRLNSICLLGFVPLIPGYTGESVCSSY